MIVLRRGAFNLIFILCGGRFELPDMIFMDISMPIMSGLEATQIIRQNPNVCNTPIIALTAHAMAQDRDDCLKAGCDGFATKPIDFQDINGFLVEYAPESFPPARSVS